MPEISKEILDTLLENYSLEYRFLVKAESNFPIARGFFKIPKCVYANSSCQVEHFTLTELSFCYNQLAYTFFADCLNKGLIKEIEKIPFKEFKEKYQWASSFIIGMDNVKFWKPINPIYLQYYNKYF